MVRSTTNGILDAKAKSLYRLYTTEGGNAGFRIPIYQREFDWDKENIARLFEDVLSGLSWLAESEDSLTFLGTIIVVREERTDETYFDAPSFSIIDGQQRLTTISLLACILYESLGEQSENLEGIRRDVREWIEEEIKLVRARLLDLIRGSLTVNGGYFPFPRLVREDQDCRGNSVQESEYRSLIAKYLNDFSHYVQQNTDGPFIFQGGVPLEGAFGRNLDYIKVLPNVLTTGQDDDKLDEISANLLSPQQITRAGIRQLFEKLPSDQTKTNRIFSYCEREFEKLRGTLRMTSFAKYLMDSVIVTLVKTGDEKYGFDIFDAVNTTGEPLTAIQTFKPLVVRFEEDEGSGYSRSRSEEYLKDVEAYLNKFSGSDARQKEAKDLIVPFALYVNGDKISRSLHEQRRYLRRTFEGISGGESEELKRRFVGRLSELADYKTRFWMDKDFNVELPGYPERELILLCLKFLKDLKNSLTIPILCRFYSEARNTGNEELFAGAVKALTAFVAIRRGATGGTAGIDSHLRGLMSVGGTGVPTDTVPICSGVHHQNPVVDLAQFRKYLREWLRKKRIDLDDKDSWIMSVQARPLAETSAPLCRFLLFAAAHNARPDNNEPGMLVKRRASPETMYLTYERWISDDVATVEHVAPESPQDTGWDPDIYSQPILRHSLGNLTLLPQEENSLAANSSWARKKNLYRGFSAESDEEVEKIIEECKKDGVNFSTKNIEMLKRRPQLPMAKSVASVEEWSASLIQQRSENLAGLAWDEISSWWSD